MQDFHRMQGIFPYFYYFIHALVLIIFKLCIYAKSISLRHKNDNFSIMIGLKSLHFSINLFPKLLSDSLSWNSSMSHHIQSCSLN